MFLEGGQLAFTGGQIKLFHRISLCENIPLDGKASRQNFSYSWPISAVSSFPFNPCKTLLLQIMHMVNVSGKTNSVTFLKSIVTGAY